MKFVSFERAVVGFTLIGWALIIGLMLSTCVAQTASAAALSSPLENKSKNMTLAPMVWLSQPQREQLWQIVQSDLALDLAPQTRIIEPRLIVTAA